MKIVDKEYITKEELCQVLKISKKTAYNLLKSGKIHFDKKTTGKTHSYQISVKEALDYKQKRDTKYILSKEQAAKCIAYYSEKLQQYPQVINIDDICAITGYCRETVRRWIKSDKITSFVIRRLRKIEKQDFVEFLISPYYMSINQKSQVHQQDELNLGLTF